MRRLRPFLAALIVSAAAVALYSARARASAAELSCGPWQICYCRQIGCNYGGQLCAVGSGFTCNQNEVTDQ